MKDIAGWLVAAFMAAFAARYARQLYLAKLDPTNPFNPRLSSWLIFLAGVCLSLATYLPATERDVQSCILNVIDIFTVSAVVAAILRWGNREVRFKPFERWYLAAAVAIVLYWFLWRDPWTSNLLVQGLVSMGFAPMIHNLISERRNTESFTAWGLILIGSSIAVYPAAANENLLATIYAARSVVLSTGTLLLMAALELRARFTSKGASP